MTNAVAEGPTGAEDVIWDLSVFYHECMDDPKVEADIAHVNALAEAFQERFRGKLGTMSADDFVQAYEAMVAIFDLSGRLESYAFLNFSTDTGDAAYQAFVAKIQDLHAAISQKMVFLSWNGTRWTTARRRRFWMIREWRSIAISWKRNGATNPTG